MTRERAKVLLPIIQAWAEGKIIQWRFPQSPNPKNREWDTITFEPTFDTTAAEYRVKPEPREFWIGMCGKHGVRCAPLCALDSPSACCGDGEIIHVREVV